jgi:hypothetical protein
MEGLGARRIQKVMWKKVDIITIFCLNCEWDDLSLISLLQMVPNS